MKIWLIVFLLVLVMLIFSMSVVYGDIFESSDNDDYLFLKISGDKAFVLLKIDGKITSIQEDVKYYKNGNFRINFENKIILIGIPSDDEIKIRIHDTEKKQKITLMVQRIDTHTSYEKPIIEELPIQEKFELSEKTEEMKIVIPFDRSEKIPRSQYIESEDKEIKILFQITKNIAYYEEFFFNIRIVDPVINGIGSDFWNDIGFVNNVEISSIIQDPNGTKLYEFEGNATKNGYYTSPRILFSYNSILSGAYTMEVNATKYFDESATFTTDSITEEFFVFIPNNNKLKSECNFLYDNRCVEICPDGTELLVKTQPPLDNETNLCVDSPKVV